ncbi:MAG TPA: FtsX-like permease family protein [Burkholderiales bacterium]|nr:FtsX-like permease family protein [Burkholderiales bacterium]
MIAHVAGMLWRGKTRGALSAAAIALGVALGYAVQIINRAAMEEMARGEAALAGEAELSLRGPRAGFSERLYAQVAALPEVSEASPALEIEARLAGRDETLRVIGIDVFRAAGVQPALIARESEPQDDPLDTLRADTLYLSPAAARALRLALGDHVALQAGLREAKLRFAGILGGGAGTQAYALMDIAAAQRLFARQGLVTRVDLRLRPGIDADDFAAGISRLLPAGVAVQRPQSALEANARLTRAYRVNLDVLALVALFTGGLLVFSAQALSVVRRRAQLALLRVLGVTRGALLRMLVAEGAIVGGAGAAAGIAAGAALAVAMLHAFGADLGAGYFRDLRARAAIDPLATALFLLLGTAAAVLGSLAPALDAARIPPAQALKSGDELHAFERAESPWPGAVLVLLGVALAWLPAVEGLPLSGYLAIALLLLGAILLTPRLTAVLARWLPEGRSPWRRLAVAQLRAASAQVSVGLAALVAAVSLTVAMAIMVASFRVSLEGWLDRVLPADLYLRAAPKGDSAYLPPETQERIRALPGVRRVEFLRVQQILLDPALPRVTLLARDLDESDPARSIPLVKSAGALPPDAPPVWVSEYVADEFRWKIGQVVSLPLGGAAHRFAVAGVWRDYARQNGALAISRATYRRLTGDATANDAGLWLAAGTDVAAVAQAVRASIEGGDRLEIAQPGEIRARSLAIFDRTFAVTYALEGAAMVIALAGLSANFAVRAFGRRREFGMLRHLGVSRTQIGAMLVLEGLVVAAMAAAIGLILGATISVILVYVVNRQSFHWSMEMHWPLGALAAFVAALLAAAVLTAVLSGRQAMSDEAVQAVKEDW